MTIKILHVFAPSLTSRFGGQSIWWKSVFEQWNTPDVIHSVLDCSKSRILSSKEAFDFEYSNIQKRTSQWERAIWIFTLFGNLIRHKKQYDILHVHVLWWGGLLIGPWANWNRIPAVYESVLLDADTPGGIVNEKFGGIKLLCLKSYRAILTISEYLAQDYRKFGFSASQIFTLMNCVDVNLFTPVKSDEERIAIRKTLSLPIHARVLVFVGSVIQRKGVDVLVRAFIAASRQHPNLLLLIVGPKNQNENPSMDMGFVNGLYSIINENDQSEQIIFTGLIRDRTELAEIYRASDIFVFPSNVEGLGNVILEAMATELPVIVSNLPVLKKIIVHAGNGLIVPIGDSDALASCILQLSDDTILAEKLGKAARKFVQTEHAFSAWEMQLNNFYRGLL